MFQIIYDFVVIIRLFYQIFTDILISTIIANTKNKNNFYKNNKKVRRIGYSMTYFCINSKYIHKKLTFFSKNVLKDFIINYGII